MQCSSAPASSSSCSGFFYEAVHAMLAVLTDKQRDLIHQQFVLGKTHQEIADDMGISRGSVTRAVNQALERIRRKFDFEAHYELAAGGLA